LADHRQFRFPSSNTTLFGHFQQIFLLIANVIFFILKKQFFFEQLKKQMFFFEEVKETNVFF
jgi:hypothetical protein